MILSLIALLLLASAEPMTDLLGFAAPMRVPAIYAAKVMGLAIPHSVPVRADEVIRRTK